MDKLNSTTFSKVVKDDPEDRVSIEVGDSKQPDFKPQVKIMRWDNEVNFSMRAEEEVGAKLVEEGGIIKYKAKNYEVHQYEKPDASEDGGFEFEWVLNKKPSTNVLTTTIQSKGLNFFYQPALTPEEITEGAFRPDNVIGSYAVYHDTKSNHKVGDKNYKCGKAFHIYRPKAIDANGAEVWADLNIIDGVLTVTVPQIFLDSAVYPVIVDPTFGVTSSGATEVAFASINTKNTSQMTLSENASVTKLTFLESTGGQNIGNRKGVIYDSSGSSANALKGTTNAVAQPNPGSGLWVDLPFSSPVSLTPADYFLGVIADANGFGKADSTGTTGTATGNNNFNNDTYSDGPSDPFGTPSTSSFEKSIYATYTASGGTTANFFMAA